MVGRNGVGKSTLLEILLGRLLPEDGETIRPSNWRVASLQQYVAPSKQTALEFVKDGDVVLRSLEKKIKNSESSGDETTLAKALADYEDLGGFQLDHRAITILVGLGFSHPDFQKQHQAFSGGWRIKLNLARTLLTPSDLLLLDEPTNHLDLEATVWLRRWLQKYEGTVLTVAHDRDFLDRVVTNIIHIDQKRAKTYKGGYTDFERERVLHMQHQEAMATRQAKERERIEVFINRFRAKESKAKQVQSRIKALERMSKVSVLHRQTPYQFSIPAPKQFDQPMASFDECNLGYDDKVVISGLTQRIYPRDRIGLLGVNGAGKSTLLKALAGELTPMSGSFKLSPHTTVGYFSQHQLEILDESKSAYEQVQALSEQAPQSVRGFLGSWGFSGDDVYRPVSQFSGGEKARLVLARIAMTGSALLVLDEPTNHLDLELRTALASALDSFDGAVVVAAHDQHLLRQCVNEFWLVQKGSITVFDGDLEDYETHIVTEDSSSKSPTVISSREKRKQRAATRQKHGVFIQRRLEIEDEIERWNQDIKDLDESFADPDFMSEIDRQELNRLMAAHSNARSRIAELEKEWFSIEERLSEYET